MCSYNSVNGKPTCADEWLLTTVARDNWKFDGYITSDCDADAGVCGAHHFHNDTNEECVRDVLQAGVDVDCGTFVQSTAGSALNQSLINESLIDTRISNLFRVRFRLGHFDPKGPLDAIPKAAICDAAAVELSLDGAAQSSVLLKNSGHTLPLDRTKVGTVAVVGPTIANSAKDAGYCKW
jgi:beta-D-xylosidase 4